MPGPRRGAAGASLRLVLRRVNRTLHMAAEKPTPVACHHCERSLAGPAEVGWECDCGIRVCREPECFAECFKQVAGGEATRCLTCGLVT